MSTNDNTNEFSKYEALPKFKRNRLFGASKARIKKMGPKLETSMNARRGDIFRANPQIREVPPEQAPPQKAPPEFVEICKEMDRDELVDRLYTSMLYVAALLEERDGGPEQ